MLLCLWMASSPAKARAKDGYTAGLSLVIHQKTATDRRHLGIGGDVGRQWFWHEGAYYYDGPHYIAPLATVALHVVWSRPVATATVTAMAGPMYPLIVADDGFIPLLGVQVGGGLGLSTDGAAGPLLSAEVSAPFTDARLDVMRWEGWHAPHLSLGLNLELNCCSVMF